MDVTKKARKLDKRRYKALIMIERGEGYVFEKGKMVYKDGQGELIQWGKGKRKKVVFDSRDVKKYIDSLPVDERFTD